MSMTSDARLRLTSLSHAATIRLYELGKSKNNRKSILHDRAAHRHTPVTTNTRQLYAQHRVLIYGVGPHTLSIQQSHHKINDCTLVAASFIALHLTLCALQPYSRSRGRQAAGPNTAFLRRRRGGEGTQRIQAKNKEGSTHLQP